MLEFSLGEGFSRSIHPSVRPASIHHLSIYLSIPRQAGVEAFTAVTWEPWEPSQALPLTCDVILGGQCEPPEPLFLHLQHRTDNTSITRVLRGIHGKRLIE